MKYPNFGSLNLPAAKKRIMKGCFFIFLVCIGFRGLSQADSSGIVLRKDPRIDLLVKKQIQINEETTRDSRRNIPGFRIQVINSIDRNKAFAAKTRIYQQFPDLKSYLIYQSPNYKLKIGNFKTEEEAQPYLEQLLKLYPTGVYIVRDIIEVKPDTL
jgi:hypothetical protein